MRKFLACVFGAAFALVAWIAFVAFAGWGFDPGSWTMEGRMQFALVAVVAMGFGAIFGLDYE